MTNTKFEVILVIVFLKMSSVNILFSKKIFIWKFYLIIKVLSTTKQVQIINLKKFVIAILDMDSKIFVVHVAILKQEKMAIDSIKKKTN